MVEGLPHSQADAIASSLTSLVARNVCFSLADLLLPSSSFL